MDQGQNLEQKESILKIAKWAIMGIIFLSIAGISIAGFYLYTYLSANQEISFSASAPKNILTGVPFNLKFNLSNNSKNFLQAPYISIFLPENVIAIDGTNDKRVYTKQLNNLEPGAGINGEIPLMIFGNNETIKILSVSLNYSSPNGGKFEKKQNIEIIIKEPAIKLDLTTPEKIMSGEGFETSINYSNISEYDFPKIKLNFIYQKNFTIKKSDPNLSNDFLEINLPKNKEGKISITGFIVGQEQSFSEIKIIAEAFYNDKWQPINEKTAKLEIASSPLSFKIESNNPDYAFLGNTLIYRLSYFNNSDTALNDAVVKTKLSGEMFDFLSLKTDGNYDSRANTIIWNASNSPKLKSIDPKNGGTIEFAIKLKQNYFLRKISDKNFIVSIDAEISSPTVPYNVAAEKTINSAKLETKIGGQIAIESTAYFKEPTFEIINSGSLPPKANSPINFTVHWKIKNYSTDVKNAVVKTILSPGIKFTGLIKSNASSTPSYNEKTNEVSWTIDKIPATKGVISQPPLEIAFQIEAVPNIIMVNNNMPLVGETSITALDEFINKEINSFAPMISTRNLSDPSFDLKNGIVIQ
ncbi:hypothetical protein HZC33_01805 [Candidatus Wolfebacteria bacterium]|nr:hypothetical protein [Candidatus Wolfebacteria bacterium]